PVGETAVKAEEAPLSPKAQRQVDQLHEHIGPRLQESGYSPSQLRAIEWGWMGHLAQNERLGEPDRVLLNARGTTIAALHGAVLTEMSIPAALEAERAVSPAQSLMTAPQTSPQTASVMEPQSQSFARAV
ncbi:MAG TPA: hypothetical protein VIN35_02640, partial [Hydrogenophaga sp.]